MKKILFYSFVFLSTITGWTNVHAEENEEGLQFIECTYAPLDRPVSSHLRAKSSLSSNAVELTNGNWSGYVAVKTLAHSSPGSVSGVTGYWTVPALNSTPDDSLCSMWVGIDGFGSSTCEQIGSLHEWNGTRQINTCWFQMFPSSSSTNIQGFPIDTGDEMSASVHYIGNNTFELTIRNHTKGVLTKVPTSLTMSSTAQRVSAEWILEAPESFGTTLPLANFGTTSFRQCTTTINNIPGTISNSNWQHTTYTMVTPGGTIKSAPSSLINFGYRFDLTWHHE